MARMLKQLVFGQKKNPPAPPRPDYEGDKSAEIPFETQPDVPFFDHDYENIPKFKSKIGSQVRFAEKKEPDLVVFDNYSEPADLRAELSALDDVDPLYMSPLDDQGGTAPPPPDCEKEEEEEEEEDMYCVPYDTPERETAPDLPQPCLAHQGFLTNKLGRKSVLLYISASYTFSWLVIAYAPKLSLVYMGRLVSGFCAGICTVAVPAYLVEISTVEIRGLLSAGFQVAFAVGVFLVMALGAVLRWSWLAIGGAVVVVCGAFLVSLVPESPPWLVRASRNAEAIEGLEFFKGRHAEAVAEFEEILKHVAEEPKGGLTARHLLDPALYKPVSIAVALMFFQQFSGINALMSYAVELFQNNKSSVDPSLAAIIVAFVQVIATAFSSFLMDRAGRRILYIASGVCMTMSLVVSGVYSRVSQQYDVPELSSWSWLPLLCFVTYMAAFSLGFGPIPFVVTPEMVPTHSRSFLLAVASVSCSFFGFVVTKTFDDMRNLLGLAGLYWTYGAFTLMGFAFYWVFIPETKGRTIRDIHRSFSVTEGKD